MPKRSRSDDPGRADDRKEKKPKKSRETGQTDDVTVGQAGSGDRRRVPRKEPRKEKRSEKRARREREQAEREEAAQIESARQLYSLFNFAAPTGPDGDDKRKHAVFIFRTFIRLVAEGGDDDAATRRMDVLREYLASEKQQYQAARRENDDETHDDQLLDDGENESNDKQASQSKSRFFLHDILTFWNLASRRNVETLFGLCARTVADVADLVLDRPELAEFGTVMGECVVDSQTVRLLNRGLSAPKFKQSLLSPCLRILAVGATVARGAFVQRLYARRDVLCDPKMISRILSTYRTQIEIRRTKSGKLLDEESEDDEDPTETRTGNEAARTHAVRYFTALVRHGDSGVKTDLLRQTSIVRALFEYLKHDPVDVLNRLLTALRINVVLDKGLARRDKSAVFNDRNLAGLLVVVRTGSDDAGDGGHKDGDGDKSSSRALAIDFLSFICAGPLAGLIPSSAFVWPDCDESIPTITTGVDGAGLDPVVRLDADQTETSSVSDPTPVWLRNAGEFTKLLRPQASADESGILIDIFTRAPCLVRWYFAAAPAQWLEPKVSTGWIAYASFLFRTVGLPVPSLRYIFSSLGPEWEDGQPPSAEAVARELIEHVMPAPVTDASLTRCFRNPSDMIVQFASRLLSVVIEKLGKVCALLDEAASGAGLNRVYFAAVRRMVRTAVLRRCPDVKTVVAAFRRAGQAGGAVQESIARLLSLFCSSMPEIALHDQFDISVVVAQKLDQADSTDQSSEDAQLDRAALAHLIHVAQCSPGFGWWNRSGKLAFSPFVSLVRLVATDRQAGLFRSAVAAVATEQGIVAVSEKLESGPTAADALVVSLTGKSISRVHFEVLDEWVNRLVRKAAKYQDDLAGIVASSSGSSVLSPLVAVVVEQWPFVLKAHADKSKYVADWICRLFRFLWAVGESKDGLRTALSALESASADHKKSKSRFGRALGGSWDEPARDEVAEELVELVAKTYGTAESEPTAPTSVDSTTTKARHEPTTKMSKADLLAEYRLEGDIQPSGIGLITGVGCVATTDPIALGTLTINRSGSGAEKDEFPELFRWKKQPIEVAIMQGDIGRLIFTLSTTRSDVRAQAFDSLVLFGKMVSRSDFKQRDRLLVLLGEALDSAKPFLDSNLAVPYTLSSFTVHSMAVLVKPAEVPDWLLRQVNQILKQTLREARRPNPSGDVDIDDDEPMGSNRPVWTLDQLPVRLANRLLLDGPVTKSVHQLIRQQQFHNHHFRPSHSTPGGSTNVLESTMMNQTTFNYQLVWLLDFYLQSVQSQYDVNLFDKSHLFERILALYSSPFVDDRIRSRIVGIVFRVANVPGGAAVLVVRYAVLDWLRLVAGSDFSSRSVVKLVWEAVRNGCLVDQVEDGGMVEKARTWCRDHVWA